MALQEELRDTAEPLVSTPAISSLATSFGLALGELAVALDRPDEILSAVRQIYLVALAAVLSAER